MKKAIILVLCLIMAMSLPAVNMISIVNAEHTMSVKVFPEYYGGGAENKTFMVENTGGDRITKVLIVFPKIQDGDSDYVPVEYRVAIEGKPGASWSATYEPALRQVTFEALIEEDGIDAQAHGNFTIVFSDGPKLEGKYTWTISTTDIKRQGYTVYKDQIIDATKPFVNIDIPEDGSIVNATMTTTGDHYMWVYVTAYDYELFEAPEGSGIKKVEIQIDSGPWIDITNNKIPEKNQYKYQIWNLEEGEHTITAKATDGAGNWNSTTNRFSYQIVIQRVTVGPTTTYDKATGMVSGSIYKTLGTTYTIAWSAGLTPNAQVSVEIYLPTYHWYNNQHGSYWVLVAKTTSDAQGGGSASFVFPTTPQGLYTIRARTGALEYTEMVMVIPGVILEPGTIIGPAMINVTATGLTSDAVPGMFPAINLICNDTDALLGNNLHTIFMWNTNGNGTLSSAISTSEHFTNTGFLMPTFEPGTYEITLGVINGNYWNGTNFVKMYTEVSGYITVSDTLDQVKKAAEDAEDAANAAKDEATAADAANAAKDEATAAKDAANAAKDEATAAKDAANAAKDAAAGVGDAKAAAEGLTIPVYLAVVFSLIAAIIAAACAILVYRKIA